MAHDASPLEVAEVEWEEGSEGLGEGDEAGEVDQKGARSAKLIYASSSFDERWYAGMGGGGRRD